MMIHSTSIIDNKAIIGHNVSIGPFTIIHGNVIIGDNTSIDSHCVMGYPTELAKDLPLVIGQDSIIRSHSIFYQGSIFGDKLITGHRVTVRERTNAGINFKIGTLCDIQGDCVIGDYVRLHSNVFIGKKSKVGNFVWIFPHVVLTNDPHPPSNNLVGVRVDDFASIAAKAVILPGVAIGKDSLVGAMSLVRQDVPDFAVVVGDPAKQINTVDKITSKFTGGPVYPWREHFERGMPWEGIGYQTWISKMCQKEEIVEKEI